MNDGVWILTTVCEENDNEIIQSMFKNSELGIMRIRKDLDEMKEIEQYAGPTLDQLISGFESVKYRSGDEIDGTVFVSFNSRTKTHLKFYHGVNF